MRKVLSLSIFLILLLLESAVLSVSAQNYMEVYRNNGNRIHLQVQDLDSVLFSDGGDFTGSHEYVDLGLSVKWATCNVGANVPYEYGEYYAWGETETKNKYDWSTYKYCMGRDSTITKYCNYSLGGYNGFMDNKTNLDLDDDVAQVKWGDNWRMPTTIEQEELREQCTWRWTCLNGINGYTVTSKKKGYEDRSIFVPAGGIYVGDKIENMGSMGFLMSSSLTSRPWSSYVLFYDISNTKSSRHFRYYGHNVRPVCP